MLKRDAEKLEFMKNLAYWNGSEYGIYRFKVFSSIHFEIVMMREKYGKTSMEEIKQNRGILFEKLLVRETDGSVYAQRNQLTDELSVSECVEYAVEQYKTYLEVAEGTNDNI
jgi:hypothetical protein